jgi:transposase
MLRKTGRAALQRHHLGPHPILRHYLERLNFRGIIRDCLGSGLERSLDHAEVLGVLVHNVLVSRGPMYRIRQWAETIEPEAVGLSPPQVDHLNDDRLVRSLEALASERGRNVFFRLALRAIKHFRVNSPRVHFDTTTVTLFGQYASSRAEPRITRGINKDHRPDLKQLVFGLNVSSDGAVPLLHHVFSGNRTDDSVHVRNFNSLRALLGTEEFVYVADSKLCTHENLRHVVSTGGQFVTVMPRTWGEDKRFRRQLRDGQPPVRWRKIHQMPNARRSSEPPDIYSSTSAGPQQTAGGDYRIVWIRSSQKAALDRQVRHGRLRAAEVELDELARKVGGRKLRSPKEIETRVRQLLGAHHVQGLLGVRVVPFTEIEHRYLRPGRPSPRAAMRVVRNRRFRLQITRDKQALRREARTDGVFPLLTSIPATLRSKRQILEIYKYQPYLEKRFALTKSDYGVAPIFLKKPIRVVGLLHVYFVAVLLSALIERQVRIGMLARDIPKLPILPEGRPTETPTTPRILENFNDVSWYEFQEGERSVSFPIELNDTQKTLLDLAEVPPTLYR